MENRAEEGMETLNKLKKKRRICMLRDWRAPFMKNQVPLIIID